jgi:single-strand DNA-binding protein
MGINRVNLSGNLTRSPELKATKSGMSVLDFGLAVNDRRKNPQTGEWEDVPNFVDCSIFGKRGESLANILEKGMKVSLEGKLRYSSWERDGVKRSKLSVIVDEIEFLSRDDGQQRRQPYTAATPAATPQQAGLTDDLYDEEIPFN